MPFVDPLHAEFGSWALGFAPYGGGDVGEVDALAATVGEGGDDAFFDAFTGFAHDLLARANDAEARGHPASARDGYLRAASFLGIGYHPIYGTPLDPRLVDAFRQQQAAFARYAALLDPPGEPMSVPYQGTSMPALFLRAPGYERQMRPTVLVGGGWDSTMVENHLGIGIAALRRGYHVLLHDGPGQGKLLIEEGLPLRHDWEHVVTPVVDAALTVDVVDPRAIVYEPWSLGGYFAPRVAAYEHRLAAIVADPGQIDVGGKLTGMLAMFGMGHDAIARLPEIDPADEQAIMDAVAADRELTWKVVRRGFWTNGAPSISAWLAEMGKWKLAPDEVAAIGCPTLVTAAESDMASSNARELYDALSCPKHFVQFTNAQGAGMHCEMLNRSLVNRVVLDWLDEILDTG